MITNNIIELDKDSHIRIDAKNTIKYTLLLDYRVPEYKEDLSFISNIFSVCSQCCYTLFFDTYDDFDSKKSYNFFGTYNIRTYDYMKQDGRLLGFADIGQMPPFKSLKNVDICDSCFNNMVLQHCIMSSYHAIITDLNKNEEITNYEIVKSKHLKTADNFNFLDKSKISRKASDFAKKSQNHKKILPFCEDISNKKFFSEIWYNVCNINLAKFKNLLNYDTVNNLTVKSIWKNIIDISNVLSAININANIVESLYYNYFMERVFNFHIFYSTVKSVSLINKKTFYSFDQDFIPTLASCKLLPNVFSRQLFLSYAISHIDGKYVDSYQDFWQHQDLDLDGHDFMRSVRGTQMAFDFYKWKHQLDLFTKYFSQYIIPIYEWCFICMMLDAIEKAFPDKDHQYHLQVAKKHLEQFMRQNYKLLLTPYCPQDLKMFKSDMIDFTQKLDENIFDVDILPRNIFIKLVEQFFLTEKNYDLNLSKNLNPEYFLNCPKKLPNPPMGRVRKFYIDLLRYNYWELDK